MLGPAVDDDDDDLPPDNLTYVELLTWLTARLGRKPTLEDVAALRWAQEQRRIRKVRRARLAAARYRWPRGGGDVPSARLMVRDILCGPEMVAFWAAAGWLLNSLPGFIAANRAHDEWITRPSTVLRLTEAAAALPAGAVFAPTPNAEAEALLSYLDWKLTGAPVLESGFVPAAVAGLDRRLAAAANAVSPDVAKRMRAALGAARDDGARRALLREYRQVGEGAAEQWPGVDRREPGAPLGLLVEPEPETEPAAPGEADGPLAGPRPPGGGGRR